MAVKATVAIVLGNEKDSNLLHSFQELLPGILQVSCMSVETLTNLVARYFLGICCVAEILSNMNKVYSFDKTLMLRMMHCWVTFVWPPGRHRQHWDNGRWLHVEVCHWPGRERAQVSASPTRASRHSLYEGRLLRHLVSILVTVSVTKFTELTRNVASTLSQNKFYCIWMTKYRKLL